MKLQEILTENKHWNAPPQGGPGTDKNTAHSYVSGFYEDAFSSYKDKEISILEIGIARGDSLLLWDQYFKNSKLIYGLDNHDQLSLEVRNHPKLKKIFANAYTEQIANMLPSFDIIIDDGPHSLDSQCQSISLYLPKLNPGGIFVIEDIQSESYIEIFKNLIPEKYRKCCKFVDLRSIKNRADDMMFVVQIPEE
jgi:hypothetical protein